jgi:hypothetical protein
MFGAANSCCLNAFSATFDENLYIEKNSGYAKDGTEYGLMEQATMFLIKRKIHLGRLSNDVLLTSNNPWDN